MSFLNGDGRALCAVLLDEISVQCHLRRVDPNKSRKHNTPFQETQSRNRQRVPLWHRRLLLLVKKGLEVSHKVYSNLLLASVI